MISTLKNCADLARLNFNTYLKDFNNNWFSEFEMGCAVDISLSSTTYGVCHLNPPSKVKKGIYYLQIHKY